MVLGAAVTASGAYSVHNGLENMRRAQARGHESRGSVEWVDENASMSDRARDYQAGAEGARSNVETKASQAPEVEYQTPEGPRKVRFDGEADGTLIDRKVSVVTSPKTERQIVRQSESLRQNGMTGRWEVPTATEKARADGLLKKLNIDNIDVVVIPE
jgi:filamentous hemagglutinin